MTSLYMGGSVGDIASPLLGKAHYQYEDPDDARFSSNTPPTSSPVSSESHFEFASDGGDGSSVKVFDDGGGQNCCPQLLKSLVAVLMAAGGVALTVLAFLDIQGDPLSSSMWVYIMGGICLFNAFMVIKNEKTILFTFPTSRSVIIELMETKKWLEIEATSLAEEVEDMQRIAISREQAEVKLKAICESQSSNVTELVQLLQRNEEIMASIRENLQHQVVEDVVRIFCNGLDNSQSIDGDTAKLLANEIKEKVNEYGIVFDEKKFLQALAMNSTHLGVISTVKRLLPREGGCPDDAFDMFYLRNNDRRQIGSVHAARAIVTGTDVSLNPSKPKIPKQTSRVNSDWNDSCSSNSGIPKKHKNRLRENLYQFRIMAFPYFRESIEGRCLFGTLIILLLVNSAINVYFSYLIRDFHTALAEKEAGKFYHIMYKFMISMVLLIPLQVLFRFMRVKLGIAWRKWLTERVLQLYFSNKVYYGLERQSKAAGASAREYKDRKKDMDNPDQRIQEDVASFTGFSLTFFLTIARTIIDLVSFSIILFSILPALFIAIILFAGLGTVFSVLVGKVLIKLHYESLQREADFRFSLVRIRENVESIAFYGGEKVEERETTRKFIRVIENMTSINFATMRLDLFTVTYNHLVNILPIFVLAHQYFTGMVEFGVIGQARAAFGHILNDLSIVIHEFNGITSFMAGIDRLFLFMKAIQELDPDRPNTDSTVIVVRECSPDQVSKHQLNGITVKEYSNDSTSKQPMLQMQNLRLETPDHKRVLVQNLNVSLAKGQNLLIAGVSGAGKSSLLRAIAGLWHNGDGEIHRSKNVYFLPQRPYCPPGSLRDQLLYPSVELGDENWGFEQTGADWSDEDLLNILDYVDLPDLASWAGDGDPKLGINSVLDWTNTLSLGEQQRLAFGRLLVNRPSLIIMDESTSALDVVAEKKMYRLLKEHLGATYVSVGHRPTLLAYHDLKLLMRDGSGYASFLSHEETITGGQEAILSSLQA